MNDKAIERGSMADRVMGYGKVLVGVYDGKPAAMAAAGDFETVASADVVADPVGGRWVVLDSPDKAKAREIHANRKEQVRYG